MTNKQIYICFIKSIIDINRTALCCPVYKIPRFSEVRRMKAWILTFLPDWDQLFFEQRHHIYGIFLRGWTEKDPADMSCHTKIHFIFMLCLAMFYDGKIYEGFRHVVSGQLCPYFLPDIFRLIGMEITQPDGIFEFTEGSFYGPSGKIDEFYTIRREFIGRQIGNNAFKRLVRYREPYNTEGQVISIQGAIRDIVKGSIASTYRL